MLLDYPGLHNLNLLQTMHFSVFVSKITLHIASHHCSKALSDLKHFVKKWFSSLELRVYLRSWLIKPQFHENFNFLAFHAIC